MTRLGTVYTWEQKIDVATRYMQLGNARLVHELTGVPYQTILDWRRTDWWNDLIEELKQIKRSKTGVRLEELVSTAMDIAKERLENGDFVFNVKTGELLRKPVSLRDAAQVANNLITRQIQMEELAEKVTTRKDTVKETLAMLSKEFAKFTREQAKANAQVIEYKDVKDAVESSMVEQTGEPAKDEGSQETMEIKESRQSFSLPTAEQNPY